MQPHITALAALCLLLPVSASARSPATASVSDSCAWLARHQLPDGHWQFNPPASVARGYANPGAWKADAGATGLALLPFFSARHTHKTHGPYREQIKSALEWLMRKQKPDGDLATGEDRPLLAHTFATIALCEAYGLTGDKEVGVRALCAVNFLVARQDSKLGGWSDSSDKPPRLSSTVWAIMAIRTALVAGFDLPPAKLEKAGEFLVSMQSAEGKYGEIGPREMSDAATAMGLVGRMRLAGRGNSLTVFGGRFTIWMEDTSKSAKPVKEPAAWLRQGQRTLSASGLSANDVVYNLYATIYMHELSDSDWDTWNQKMRKQVIESQIKSGDEAGSWWNPNDAQASEYGRLLQTVANTMMLEVYY